jgi:hypothetical protein
MERQVISENKDKIFNKTTVFLTKFIFGDHFDMMKKLGLIDSYVEDPEIMKIVTPGKDQRILFLLFKNKKLTLADLKKITLEMAISSVQVVFSYELINDYSMIVVDFPQEFIYDYDCIKEGKYSKLSGNFKSRFPMTVDVYNDKNIKIGKEYTLYHHIFNRTDWLKNFWLERLGLMELDEKLELWEQPLEKDLIFNINKIEK